MVKIEFTAQAEFRLVDRGLIENQFKRLDSLRIQRKDGVGFDGSISKDSETGIYGMKIRLGFLHSVEIKAESPGLDSIIETLNRYDWSSDIQKYQEDQLERSLLGIPYEEIKEKTWFDRYLDARYQEGSVGLVLIPDLWGESSDCNLLKISSVFNELKDVFWIPNFLTIKNIA